MLILSWLVFSAHAQDCSQPEVCDGMDNDCNGLIDDGGDCPCTVNQLGLDAYLFCDFDQTWAEASATCSSVGYHLATIDDGMENVFVTAFTGGTSYAWIGLHDQNVEDAWEWEDGTAVAYTAWAANQPDNAGNADCVHLHSWGEWNDLPCNWTIPAMCEHCSTPVMTYIDEDGDGYGPDSSGGMRCPRPGYVEVGGDCNDNNVTVNPDATEVCNDGIDNDCDGQTDLDATWWEDLDEDGYGDEASSLFTVSCNSTPTGYVNNPADCDDRYDVISPDDPELCDGVDNNCDGLIDEGGACGGCASEQNGPSTYQFCDTPLSWDEASASCTSMSYELITIDDGEENTWARQTANLYNPSRYWIGLNDLENEGTFVWPDGSTPTYTNWRNGEPNNAGNEDCTEVYGDGGWNDLPCTRIYPYICENNCDSVAWFGDYDQDGHGTPLDVVFSCVQPDGYVDNHGDCNDQSEATL